MAHLFYTKMIHILRRPNGAEATKYRWANYAISAMFLVSLVRILLGWWNLVTKEDWYVRYEIFAAAILDGKNYHPNIVLCMALLAIFGEYTNRFLFVRFTRVGRSVCPLIEELSLLNFEDIVASNPRLFESNAFSIYRRSIPQLFWHLWFQSRAPRKFRIQFNRKLSWFPDITPEIRTRMFVVMIVCDVIFTYMIRFAYILTTVVQVFYIKDYIRILESRSYANRLWYYLNYAKLVQDMINISYAGVLCIKMGLSLMGVIFIILSTLVLLIRRLNTQFGQVMQILRRRLLLKIRVRRIIREHSRVIAYVVMGDRVWQPEFGIYVLTNLPIHSFIISFVYYRRVDTYADKLTVSAILGLQTFFSICSMLPLAYLSELIHCPSRLHVNVQQHLTANALDTTTSVHLKWKLLAHYETVHSHKKIGYKAGVFGVATKKNLFEFALVYFVYLLFFAKLIRTNEVF